LNRRRVVILGASGNALDILDIMDALGAPWEAAGVLDDKRDRGSKFADLPIVGALAEAATLDDAAFINGIASERTHHRKLDIIAGTGLDADRFVTLIHPLAAVSSRAEVGNGSCIGPGCAVAGKVEIGAHAWLGSRAVIGHHCVLGVGVTVAPSATLGGGVTLGAQAYVGSGAMLRPGITVEEGALIGMGAVVLRDVPAGMVVVGNPARPLLRSTGLFGTAGPMPGGRLGSAGASALSQEQTAIRR
jgi:sugar O-acyltransferase (sialic acid O-acetyltransferase NeuD family)